MQLTEQYYMEYWNNLDIRINTDPVNDELMNFRRALQLLTEYAQVCQSLLPFDYSIPNPKRVLGFFVDRSSDYQYRSQVLDTVKCFYQLSGVYNVDIGAEEYHTVAFLLVRLKDKMNNIEIDSRDNLSQLLKVIHSKTGIDYNNANATILGSMESGQDIPDAEAIIQDLRDETIVTFVPDQDSEIPVDLSAATRIS